MPEYAHALEERMRIRGASRAEIRTRELAHWFELTGPLRIHVTRAGAMRAAMRQLF